MAEYRIVAKLDPQTAAGTQKVKQDLRGIQAEANATEAAINRSFDQAKFDKSIGGIVGRLDQLDKKLSGASSSAQQAGKGFDSATGALDRMTAAEFRAAGGLDGLNRSEQRATQSAGQMEAALRRVLQATDAEAAEQLRLNALLADANRLYQQNAISLETLNRVQQLATQSGQQQVAVTGSQRIGMQQLGFQLGDVATMYSLGAKPAQIFASQIGQVTQALQLMSNGSNRFLQIMGGPWGVALSVGAILLAPFVAKLFEGNDALGDGIKKLQDDAKETENAAKAKEAYGRTIEGVTAAIREQNEELKKSLQTQGDVLKQQMTETRVRLATIQARREDAARALQDARDLYEFQKQRASGSGQGADLAQLGLERSKQRIVDAERAYNALAGTVATAEENIRRADAALAQSAAERAVDPIQRLNDEYDRQRKKMIESAVASSKFSAPALARELTQLELRRTAALEAAAAQERLNKARDKPEVGAATFRSQRQAIGIAGRELQAGGLRVNEGLDFGGITRGAHQSSHRNAIDVNQGKGVVEANVPDIKAKFDALARRYQARGYRVLWNGKIWPAGGNGPGPAIQGKDKHYDHMHLEAPTTIVGKATNASTEAQTRREEGQEERLQERAEDFVANVVSDAATRGLPADAQSQLNAAIDQTLQEFEQRFNRAADAGEKATITKAFTDADARETAQRFQQAYVDPLKRLQDLQGKTGIDRAVLNAKIEETLRLSRELTPVEAEMIENGIRGSDQLTRQAQLLEQIRGPLEAYRDLIADLNALLEKGDINQSQFNSRVAELTATAANAAFAGLDGTDPGTGQTYSDLGAVTEENARYAKQMEEFVTYREQLLQLGVDYDALELAAKQQHSDNLAAIDDARREVQLNAYAQAASSVTSILSDAFGKQSRIARAAFVAEKALAIARAGIALAENVAQAAKIGFPQNIPFIVGALAQGATIMASIRSAGAAVQGQGYKEGGYTGDGGVNSEAGAVHGQEFVVKAPFAKQNRSLLEALNSGRQVRQISAGRASEAAGRAAAAAQPVVVPAPQVNLRTINVTDPRMVEEFFATPEGEQVFVNLVGRNADTIRRAAGGGAD